MADTTTHPMTVAELDQLPDSELFRYELRHGELIKVPPPKARHYKLQRRLRQLLERAAAETGIVDTEFAFRALPEYECSRPLQHRHRNL